MKTNVKTVCLTLIFIAAALLVSPLQAAPPDTLVMDTFDSYICGWSASPPVALAFDPAQDDTGNGGGSCYAAMDASTNALFNMTAVISPCCLCGAVIAYYTTNFASIEFDVLWDNTSTLTPALFDLDPNGQAAGLAVGALNDGVFASVCFSNILIPDAATNGWAHVSQPLNPAVNLDTPTLIFQKMTEGFGDGASAKFWIDNVELRWRVPAPKIVVLPAAGSGSFTLKWSGISAASYTVQQSFDLKNWQTLAAGLRSDYSNNVIYTDDNADQPAAFYRVTSP